MLILWTIGHGDGHSDTYDISVSHLTIKKVTIMVRTYKVDIKRPDGKVEIFWHEDGGIEFADVPPIAPHQERMESLRNIDRIIKSMIRYGQTSWKIKKI